MMGRKNMKLITALAAAAVLMLNIVPGSAQQYPTRPIRLVVPFAAGGAADLVARLVGQAVGERLGQSVVIENRPGATGTIGSLAVARAAPDGYTILMTVISSHAVQPVLKKEPPFDPIGDFTPIVRIANSIQTLVARNNLPASNVTELVAYAKQNPGKVNYGSSGVGSFPHLGGKMMERAAGLDMVHVPFNGDGPAMNAIIAQSLDILFTPSARSHVEAKSVKLIGISALQRSRAIPDWPTLHETGLPGFELVSWVGFMAPAGTPADVVARLNRTTNEALTDASVRTRLEQIGYSVAGGSPADFADAIRNDIARFKALNITID
jgi:tripartite-type tricarboxylate transporter receptor subunit TctC